MTNAEIVRRYLAAQIDHDYDIQGAMRHPDWTAVWPQSGETVHGDANMRAILEHYPGGAPRLAPEGKLVGSEDRWAVSPLGGAYRVAGEGENWWGDWQITYPDGTTWRVIILIELRDGKIYRETSFWAEPFAAAEWRAQWVERSGEGGGGGRALPRA
jgi:ketosteroid isomerase-like protein